MNVPLMSGIVVGFASCLFVAVFGCWALSLMVKRAKANGEGFVAQPTDVFEEDTNIPSGRLALVPLLATLILINIKVNGQALIPLEYGVGIGAVLTILLLNKYIDNSKIVHYLGEGVKSSTLMIFSTCAVVGFWISS